MKKLSIYLFLLVIVFSGCKKYEEGPLISLRSKEKRLCQEWQMINRTINGENTEIDILDVGNYTWDIQRSGDLTVQKTYYLSSELIIKKYALTWEWSDDKEAIIVIENVDKNGLLKNFMILNETEEIRFNILKLKYNELVLEYSKDDENHRMEFEQKD